MVLALHTGFGGLVGKALVYRPCDPGSNPMIATYFFFFFIFFLKLKIAKIDTRQFCTESNSQNIVCLKISHLKVCSSLRLARIHNAHTHALSTSCKVCPSITFLLIKEILKAKRITSSKQLTSYIPLCKFLYTKIK